MNIDPQDCKEYIITTNRGRIIDAIYYDDIGLFCADDELFGWIESSVREDSLVCLTYNKLFKFNILKSKNIDYIFSKDEDKIYVRIKDITNVMISDERDRKINSILGK